MADPQPVKVPPTFKTLLPFIRRAEELDRDTSRPESKLIAYFCRQYAMELGIKLRENDTSNEATDYLLSLMDRLEGEKDNLPEFTQEEGKEICEDFATEIFAKADDEDRTGIATKSTARTFYAAGTFFDVLHQFGDISEDVQEKRRYCKYKAATILKAIKEGKVPTPGSPGEMDMRNIDNGSDDAAPASSASSAMTSAPQPAAPALPRSDSPPPQPVEQSSFPSRTESVRSAGAMSASELDSICHRPSSTQPPTLPSAPSHSVPAPMYSAHTAPASSHQSPPAPASAYQPPATPASPAYQTPLPSFRPPATPAPPAPQAQLAPLPSFRPSATPAPPAPQAPLSPLPSFRPPSAPTPSNQPPTSYTSQQTPVRARTTLVSQSEINDAIEFAKFAVAALKVKDMKLAEERLEMALRNIRGA